MCLEQLRGCFFSSLCFFFNTKKCVFKASGNLLFSLLSYFSNMKNVCSKESRGCFLIHLATFLIQKIKFIKLLFNTENVFLKQTRGCLLVY